MSPHALTEADDRMELLRSHVSAPVALPGERVYDRAMPWNVAVPVQPAAVVVASTAAHVAEVMRFASQTGLRVAVQATGHGAVPIGADTVLVLTSGLTGCVVDPVGRTARVGAGITWQTVLDAATPHGLAPLVRTVGLSADYVRAFELVTGGGETLRVTPDEHADLFWGLRGGKSMLGIVTSVEIDLLPITEFYGGALYFDGADASHVLDAWQRWTVELPDTVNTSICIQQLPPLPGIPEPLAGRMTVAVRYAAVGTPTMRVDCCSRCAPPRRS